jgi:class I fructose-bisphosphate aldolase
MSLGKQVRLNRIFGHASGRFCSVAVDHFIGYQAGIPQGLRDLRAVIKTVVAGRPDALTMHKGVAASCWGPHAGKVPLIIQSIAGRPDDTADECFCTPEEALRMGADGFACAGFLRGATEGAHLTRIADFVREARHCEIPVIAHVYPRRFLPGGKVEISFAPEDIAWVVRCAVETGVDVIKVPYCGDVASYRQIVRSCPLPVVAAGGPKAQTLQDALTMAHEVMTAGARGMTIGRNIWGFPQAGKALAAFQAVIHDRATPQKALKLAGLASAKPA